MQLLVIGSLNSEVAKAIEIAKNNSAKVFLASNIEDALSSIRNGRSADLILADVKCDIRILRDALEKERISSKIVAYGLNSSPSEAVASIKEGAHEFLPLPPDENLIASILEAISTPKRDIIYQSDAMEKIILIAEKVAKSDANILLTGKSGTGKEVIADFIHKSSNRVGKNFIRVNCAAIPEHLLESELFGHEKGAFTGAVSRRIGKFEESSSGTLLLDEISEMDVRLQAKLLRAIQEREIDRVGGGSPIKVDLRIIATSNRDLIEEVKNGRFREDLYFRLNIINIKLPDLIERKEDIIPLANFFIEKYSNINNCKLKSFSSDAIFILGNHNWPGNIRELENTIHRAVLLSDGDLIQSEDLMLNSNLSAGDENFSENNETKFILNTVKYCLGDLNQAANILGISINNLSDKLKKLELVKS